MALPTGAWADIPIPMVFGFMAMTWVATLTFGLSLAAVILLEGAILSPLLRIPFLRGLRLAAGANLITTLLGFIFFFPPMEMLIIWFLAFVVGSLIYMSLGEGKQRFRLLLVILAVSPILAMISLVPIGAITGEKAHLLPAIYLSLIPALLLSWVIEAVYIGRMHSIPKVFPSVLAANAASYVLLAVLFFSVGLRAEENPLLSSADLHVFGVIRSQLNQGDLDKALETIHLSIALGHGMAPRRGPWLRTFQDDLATRWRSFDYYGIHERWGARALARAGYRREAIEILQIALQHPKISAHSDEEIRELMAEYENISAEQPSPESTGP